MAYQIDLNSNIVLMSDPYYSPNKNIPKMTRFTNYNEVFMYSKSKDAQGDQSLLLTNNDMEYQQNDRSEVQRQIEHEIDPELVELEAEFKKMRQEIIDDKDQKNPKQINTIAMSQPKELNNQPISTHYQQNNTQVINGRDTMNVQQANGMKQCAVTLDDNELSNNKRKKNKIIEKMKQGSPLQQKIEEQIKRRQRITMDVNSLINLVQSYGKQEQSNMSVMQKVRKSRITLDIGAITEMLTNDLQKQNSQNQTIVQKGDIQKGDIQKSKRSIKSKVQSKISYQEQIKLAINRYYDQVENRVRHKQREKAQMAQQIETLKKRIKQKEVQIKLEQTQIEQTTYQTSNLVEKIRQITAKCTEKRYINTVSKIRQIEGAYNLQIKKYYNDRQGGQFYGEFILGQIYIKLRQQKLKNVADLRITNCIMAQLQPTDNLFEIQNVIKIVKNYFKHRLETLSNISQILLKIVDFVKKLRSLQQDISNIMLLTPLIDLQINSSMDRLNFKLVLLPQKTFIFDVDLMKINEGHSISIYNLHARDYYNIPSYQQYSNEILNAVYHLINDNI